MLTSPINSVIEHLRTAVLLDSSGLGDGELLRRFIEHRDEVAFAALVKRHGPMVWGVCRRLLNYHDAEDAFQATFLVLVRKAASIVPREMVGNWLYGVAHQAALQASRTAARRRAREVQVTVMSDPAAVQPDPWPDVQRLLDQELSRLPDIYRAVIVLCDLVGRTRKEVARQLGVPEGTVAGRLTRARAMLAKRLTQRGVTVSGGVLAAVLAQNGASAGVPDSVVSCTISAAGFIAGGQAAATGQVSAKAAVLTEGVLRAMMMSKLKAVIAVVLVLGFIVTGVAILASRSASALCGQPAAEAPAKAPPDEEKEPFTAWGKEVGGLQAGLGFHLGEKRAYSHGETVKLVVRVRNVGREDVKFQYFKEFFHETPPAVTDGKGTAVIIPGYLDTAIVHTPVNVSLAPGKEIELYELNLQLRPARESGNRSASTVYGTGKIQIQYEQVLGNSSAGRIKLDSTLSKLATGKLELEVKADAPSEKEKKAPPKQEPGLDKEAFTAWGKEVGGLQAGLGYHPGHKRAYHHGETVKLVVRVRNVSKEKIPFQYIYAFLVETPPAITDPDGKAITLRRYLALGLQAPRDVDLAPGKEVELYELQVDLRPASERDNKTFRTLYGTGKFQIQYDQVIGKSSGGGELDPKLYTLATGKLELEVKEKMIKADEDADKKEQAKFQGKWTSVAVTADGKVQEEEEFKHRFQVVKGDQATFLYDDKELGTVSLKFDPTKRPAHVDATYVDGPVKGMTLKAIYKFDGDTLTICYGDIGGDRPTEFASAPGSRTMLVALKKAVAKHDFTNLKRLAAALENFNFPENTATTITVWCQGGGKGTSAQVTDAKSLDVAAACHMSVDGHHDKKGLDLENVAIVSADGAQIRFVNIKENFAANKPAGITVNRGDLVVVLQLRNP
jgi:RNA polymerase sigma factor (sigma-70 family)